MKRALVLPRTCVALLLAAIAGGALAHHSFAVFFDDSASIVTLRGVVTDFKFLNPHGVIRMTVRTKDGKEELWKVETNSPSILERRGWKKDSIKMGEEIQVEGWPARDGTKHMRMRKVTRADGQVIGIPFESMEQR